MRSEGVIGERCAERGRTRRETKASRNALPHLGLATALKLSPVASGHGSFVSSAAAGRGSNVEA